MTESSNQKKDQDQLHSTPRRSARLQAKQKERENPSNCINEESSQPSIKEEKARTTLNNITDRSLSSLSTCDVSSSFEAPRKRRKRAAGVKSEQNHSPDSQSSCQLAQSTKRSGRTPRTSQPPRLVASVGATASNSTSNSTSSGSEKSGIASRTRLSSAKSTDSDLSESRTRGRKKPTLKKASDSAEEKLTAAVEDISKQSSTRPKSARNSSISESSTSAETTSPRKRRPSRHSSVSTVAAGGSPAKRRRTDSNSTRTEPGIGNQRGRRGKQKEEVDLFVAITPKTRGRAKPKDSLEKGKGRLKGVDSSDTPAKSKGKGKLTNPSEPSQSSARTQSRGRTQEKGEPKGGSAKGKGRARGNPSKGKGKARYVIVLPPLHT